MMLSGPEKTEVLRDYYKRYNFDIFIETGTADHLNVEALKDTCQRIFTIELDHGFYMQAIRAFVDDPHITPIYGDSGKVLEDLLYILERPALVWLDSHFCGGVRGDKDTPVQEELHFLAYYPQKYVILIDDARMSESDPAYPSLFTIQSWAETNNYSYNVQDDIIRLVHNEI